MIWFVTKVLLRGLLILALIPILLGLLLANEGVNGWLFNRLMALEPRLEIEHAGGTLWDGWRFDRIRWQADGLIVVVEDVATRWETLCLGDGKLCIEEIAIGTIAVQTDPSQAAEEEPGAGADQPITLPDIQLPVALQLDRLHIGEVFFNSDKPLLTDVTLTAMMRGDRLAVTEFVGSGPDIGWQLDGELRTAGDWPLMVRAQIDAPPVNEEPLAVRLRLGGSLERLLVEVQTQGYVAGRLEGTIKPLEPSLPMELAWQGEPFLPLDTLPETLTLTEWQVSANGDLDEGIAVTADATLPGSGGDVRLALNALVQQTRLPELTLTLAVADNPERALMLEGEANWAEQLTADAELTMDQFPWTWLYPVELGELEVESIQAQASVRGTEFETDLTAALSGVAGQDATIQMQAQGSPEQITLSNLEIQTPAGRAAGQAVVGLGEATSWDAEMTLADLDPGVFVEQLPGKLSGPVSSKGTLGADGLAFTGSWDLDGTLRDQPLDLSGAVVSEDGSFAFSDLVLRQGPNSVTGAGVWGERIAADLDISLNRLATLWPGLEGALTGTLDAVGDQSSPTLQLALAGRDLSYETVALAALDVSGSLTLNERLPMDLGIQARQIRTGETVLGNLAVDLDGDKGRHELVLDLSGGELKAQTRVSGSLDEQRWQGSLTQGLLAYQDMAWRLLEDAAIVYRLEPAKLTVEAHCWTHEAGRLCFEDTQQLLPDRQLAVVLSDFPLASLEQWLPEDLAWLGSLDAQMQLRQAQGGQPVGSVRVSSEDGVIRVSNPQQTLDFEYSQLELTSDLDAKQAVNRLLLTGDTLGRLEVQATVAEPAGAQQLSGEFSLEGFNLDFIRPFLPQVETLEAELDGQGQLAGTLRDPQVNGVIQIEDGLITGPELPVSFEQLDLEVAIAGQTAAIDGDWVSGEGEGSLDGEVTWAPELKLALTLTGSRLPVVVAPYANLVVSPDLRVGLVDNQLRVRGRIAVPEGKITIRELPEQAVRVSSDEVIVGADEEEVLEEELPLDVDARVQLVIGDQLRFSGFGLTGRLSGRIQVDEQLTANGDLNILDGRFRRFGQRLTLRRAQILFAGPISQPFLNIEAIRTVDDVIAGLRLTGRADAPESEVFSEPALPQEEALSYLVLGRPLGGDGGDNNMLGQAALALGMAGSGPLTQNIARSLGIENFQLETEGSGTDTQVVAAGYLTDRLSLRYGVGVFEPANQLALRYDLTKRLYLEAVSGLASSLDFFYRIDF